jgi:copper(I)-binding protein
MTLRRFVLAIFCSLFIQHAAFAADAIQIEHSWIREAPPGADVLAGYLTIKNNGAKTITLTGVESPICNMIMMHKTIIENNVARMVMQENVKIDPGKTVSFRPGGMHLMIMGPKTALHTGDKIKLVLLFKNGEKKVITVPVRKATAADTQTD